MRIEPALLLSLVALLSAPGVAKAATAERAAPESPIQSIPTPASWVRTKTQVRNDIELIGPRVGKAGDGLRPRIHIWVEARIDHADAVMRLSHFLAARSERATDVIVDGWPALERVWTAPLPPLVVEGGHALPREGQFIAIVVAAADSVIRVDGTLARDDPRAAALVETIREVAVRLRLWKHGDPRSAAADLARLRAEASRWPDPSQPPLPGLGRILSQYVQVLRPTPVRVPGTTMGEIDIAMRGTNVLLGNNDGFFSSTNGAAFVATAMPVATGAALASIQGIGDPSVTAAQSGAFYASQIGVPNSSPAAASAACTLAVSRTGAFPALAFQSVAKSCTAVASSTCFPDQPFIRADRWNASSTNADQVYAVWRNYDADDECFDNNLFKVPSPGGTSPHLACSRDGGSTWPIEVAIGSGDDARLAVGRDGTVYVIYRDDDNLMVDRYSSCATNLVHATGFPVAVASVGVLPCPIPGIDRCDSTVTTSYSIAADDTEARRVVVAYGRSVADGNDAIELQISYDFARDWSAPIQVNDDVPGRRYFPAVCVTSGNAFVGWYDRRDATPDKNDLTDYYLGVTKLASRVPDKTFADVNLSASADPQCASGWPAPPRSKDDATSCNGVQLAGMCGAAGLPGGCAFDDPKHGCAGSLDCNSGGGLPKYGDYNLIDCDGGRIVAAWASATAPGGIAPLPPPPAIRVFETRLNPPTVTLNWTALPTSSLPRQATVLVDDDAAAVVRDKGTSAEIVVNPGSHSLGVFGIWGAANMQTTFSGACSAAGAIDLANGEHKTCDAITKISASGLCLGNCTQIHERCQARPGPLPTVANPGARHDHEVACQTQFAECLKRCGE